MKTPEAPSWSFLAVEPLAKRVTRKAPEAHKALFSKRATLAVRSQAFWTLFELACLMSGRAPGDPLARYHAAIQFFYALVDLSENRSMPDRELQRWLNAICGATAPTPATAVVHVVHETRIAL
jgi:hypothetical protein